MDNRSTRWGAAVAVLALAVAGCGGSDTPTKAAFIKKADGICKKANAELQDFNSRLEGATKHAKSIDEALDKAAPTLKDAHAVTAKYMKQLKDLDLPKDKAGASAVIETLQDLTDSAGDLADAADKGDAQAFTKASQANQTEAKDAQAKGSGYGFKECGTKA